MVIGSDIQSGEVDEALQEDAKSIGAMHGSARGKRNVTQRMAAFDRLVQLGGERLLDIGCGTGEYTTTLAELYTEVDGIEIERLRLEAFERNKPDNVAVHLMSANDMNFEDDTFDTVVMIEVLEHLADTVTALAEIRRVLKPTGRLLLTTPSRRWPLEQHGVLFRGKRYPSYYAPGLVWAKPLHKKMSDADAFEPSDLRRLADQTGLEVDGITFMMPPLDSLPYGHIAHTATERIEERVSDFFGQTIVASLRPKL